MHIGSIRVIDILERGVYCIQGWVAREDGAGTGAANRLVPHVLGQAAGSGVDISSDGASRQSSYTSQQPMSSSDEALSPDSATGQTGTGGARPPILPFSPGAPKGEDCDSSGGSTAAGDHFDTGPCEEPLCQGRHDASASCPDDGHSGGGSSSSNSLHVDVPTRVFRTRRLPIRAWGRKDRIPVNGMIFFRVEHDVGPDPTMRLGFDLLRARSETMSSSGHRELRFQTVSTESFLFRGRGFQSLHFFCAPTFQDVCFCELDVLVHFCLLDFRLRLPPRPSSLRGRLGCPASPKPVASLADALVKLADAPLRSGASAEVESPDKEQCVDKQGIAPSLDAVLCAAARLQQKCTQAITTARCGLVAFRLCACGTSWPDSTCAIGAKDREGTGAGPITPPSPFPPPPLKQRTSSAAIAAAAALAATADGATAAVPAQVVDEAALEEIAALMECVHAIATGITTVWRSLMCTLALDFELAAKCLRPVWDARMEARWEEFVIQTTASMASLAIRGDQTSWASHAQVAQRLRRPGPRLPAACASEAPILPAPPRSLQPVLFEERYCSADEGGWGELRDVVLRTRTGCHLVILVHGFQGCGDDMRILRDYLSLVCPQSFCICSRANELDTDCELERMGWRLAEEVKACVLSVCGAATQLNRLSFIAHSAGGLIVRCAIPHLGPLTDKLHTFFSLSTPHLGYVGSTTALLEGGLWLLRRLRGSRFLDEVTLADRSRPDGPLLRKLADSPGLEWFQKVVLVSSKQDKYVPLESARIEAPCRLGQYDPALQEMLEQMVQNVVHPLDPEKVMRIDVDFAMPDTTLDTVIGRAAHIQFIDNPIFLQMVTRTYRFLFM